MKARDFEIAKKQDAIAFAIEAMSAGCKKVVFTVMDSGYIVELDEETIRASELLEDGVYATYRLPSGKWQTTTFFNTRKEAEAALEGLDSLISETEEELEKMKRR